MRNLFDYKNYRPYLADLCSSNNVKRGFQSGLARAAGCQAAYFSQVLRQKVHLTEDQLFSLSEYLQMSSAEINFLTLLLRYEKAGTEKLRKHLESEISKAKAEQNKISSRIPADHIIYSEEDLGHYFSTWIISAIHVLTSSKYFQSVDKISNRLHLSKEKVKITLEFLVKLGWIKQENQQYCYSSGNLHIPKDSPIQSSMQATRRHLAMNSIALNSTDSLHYSSIYTLDSESYNELQTVTTSFIQKSAKIVNDGGTDDLYALCVDLFRVP